jgi:xylose isomerase
VRPEGAIFRRKQQEPRRDRRHLRASRKQTGVKLLWGTANLFSNRRYMAGAATNPDPDVFAYAAAHGESLHGRHQRLGGENYVLWGGREGYETLLNTDLKREREQAGRFLSTGRRLQAQDRLQGHDPDRAEAAGADQAPVRLRRRHGLRLPQGFRAGEGGQGQYRAGPRDPRRALLRARTGAGRALGIFGSIDMNRNDYQSGWDTDQFPNNVPEMALAFYEILQGGGFTTGGTNFDAKMRRQSLDPEDATRACRSRPGTAGCST